VRRIEEADNGKTGFAIMQTAKLLAASPVIILLDSQLPEMNGFEIIRALQGDPMLDHIILMLTSEMFALKANEPFHSHLSGALACLSKPLNPSRLFNTILTVLAKSASAPPSADLPDASRETRPMPEDALRPADAASVTRLRILLAEDHPVNQMVVEKWLTNRGWDVTIVGNGKDALEILNREEFDLILMDIQMPKMDGLTTTKIIRELEQGRSRHIPIIALTAHAMEGDKDRFLAAGMDGYVAKPLNSKQLYATIEACVAAHPQHPPVTEALTAVPAEKKDPLNLEELFVAFDEDANFVEELLATFLQQSVPEILNQLRAAATAEAADAAGLLEQAAHRLKGAAGVIGAWQVYATAQTLEDMGHRHHLTGMADLLVVLQQQLAELTAYLATHLAQ